MLVPRHAAVLRGPPAGPAPSAGRSLPAGAALAHLLPAVVLLAAREAAHAARPLPTCMHDLSVTTLSS